MLDFGDPATLARRLTFCTSYRVGRLPSKGLPLLLPMPSGYSAAPHGFTMGVTTRIYLSG